MVSDSSEIDTPEDQNFLPSNPHSVTRKENKTDKTAKPDHSSYVAINHTIENGRLACLALRNHVRICLRHFNPLTALHHNVAECVSKQLVTRSASFSAKYDDPFWNCWSVLQMTDEYLTTYSPITAHPWGSFPQNKDDCVSTCSPCSVALPITQGYIILFNK